MFARRFLVWLVAASVAIVPLGATADPGEGDAPDDWTQALPIGDGHHEGTVGDGDEADWYALDHAGSPGVWLAVSAPRDGPHLHAVVLSGSGKLLADWHVSPQDSAFPWAGVNGRFSDLSTGRVLVGVVLVDVGAPVAPYHLEAHVDPPFACEDGDVFDRPGDAASAHDVEAGGYGGHVGCPGDAADWFRVEPPPGWRVRAHYGLPDNGPHAHVRMESDDGAHSQEIHVVPQGGAGGVGGSLDAWFDGAVRFGVLLLEGGSWNGEPFGYGVGFEFLPPPDVAVTGLRVENVPTLTTDGVSLHSGMHRRVFVDVTNFGQWLAPEVRLVVTATTVSDRVSRVVAEYTMGVDFGRTATLEASWNAGGQVGDVELRATIEAPNDPEPWNDERTLRHYAIVGGTQRGYTIAPHYPFACAGDPQGKDPAACAIATTDLRFVMAGLFASALGRWAGAFVAADTVEPGAFAGACAGQGPPFAQGPATCGFGAAWQGRAGIVAVDVTAESFRGAFVAADANEGAAGAGVCTNDAPWPEPDECTVVCAHREEPFLREGWEACPQPIGPG
ncbi:MAG TPA: hypothetical protein VM681_01150 [Candidatus Thermoplasmatota archaeon]|nr:hypothetical protein [Candidatus Thermoplasmatota archaeon]